MANWAASDMMRITDRTTGPAMSRNGPGAARRMMLARLESNVNVRYVDETGKKSKYKREHEANLHCIIA